MNERMFATFALTSALLAWLATAGTVAVLDLKKGDPAPSLSLRAVDGSTVALADLRGRDVVLLFGDTGHEKSIEAARRIAEALQNDQLRARPIEWITIYSKSSDREQIERTELSLNPAVRRTLVHDVERTAFGAYEVVAMPSAVVIDASGLVVHAMAGLSPRFGEIIEASLLLAAGAITDAQHEKAVHGLSDEHDETLVRAERHGQLARRLHRRGMNSLAESEYRMALDLADMTGARLGLGDLLIELKRLDEAEAQFRAVLASQPRSLEATTGLAFIHALRGGDELAMAEKLASGVIERNPSSPRVHYVLGLIHEARDETRQAATMYKRAAELLMRRIGPEEAEQRESE